MAVHYEELQAMCAIAAEAAIEAYEQSDNYDADDGETPNRIVQDIASALLHKHNIRVYDAYRSDGTDERAAEPQFEWWPSAYRGESWVAVSYFDIWAAAWDCMPTVSALRQLDADALAMEAFAPSGTLTPEHFEPQSLLARIATLLLAERRRQQ